MTKPTSHYAGVTAYIQNSADNADQFRILAEAIPQFKPFADMTQAIPAQFKALYDTMSFRNMYVDSRSIVWQNDPFPEGTPDELKTASITEVTIAGRSMSRIYLPVVFDDVDFVEVYATHGMRNLLTSIFGENLVTIKNRYASHRRSFADATTEIVVSAEKALA